MFDLDQFIADCRAALAADKSHKNVRENGSLWALELVQLSIGWSVLYHAILALS